MYSNVLVSAEWSKDCISKNSKSIIIISKLQGEFEELT
jgi:hypothetical protein